jgi:hypothetical protein
MKEYSDKRSHATPHAIGTGDVVLVKQPKKDKLSTPFDPNPLFVTDTNHSMITAQRADGSRVTRNSSMFRKMQGMVPSDIFPGGNPLTLDMPAESRDPEAITSTQGEGSEVMPPLSLRDGTRSQSIPQDRPKRPLKKVKRLIEEM